MKKYRLLKLILLGLVALAAEVSVLTTFTMFGARLELLFLLCCFGALFLRNQREVIWCSWTLGMLKDLGGPGPLGLYALLFLATGLMIVRARQVIFREHPLIQASVAFCGAAAIVLLDALVTALFAGRVPWSVVFSHSLGAALFAAIAAPVVIFVITRPRWLLR